MLDLIQEKRIVVYLIIGLLVAATAGLLIYRFFTPGRPLTEEEPIAPGVGGGISTTTVPTPPAPLPPVDTGEPPQGATPAELSQKRVLKITNFPVVSPSLNKTGDKILFYRKDGGDLLATDLNGQNQEKISNFTILGLTEALWSPAKERAAVFYIDGETLKAFLHAGTSTVIALPNNIKGFAWSPDGKSLAYLLSQGKKLNLVITDAGGKKPRTAFQTSIPGAEVRWVAKSLIAFQNLPSGTAEGHIFIFSAANRTFRKLIGPRHGLMSRWTPDGKIVLVSATDSAGKNPTLTLFDSRGKKFMETNLQTIPEKCAASINSKYLYCAVPRFISTNDVWPDKYLRGEITTSDRIIVINLAQKIVTDAFDEENFDVTDSIVTKDGEFLFFVNRPDGTLWRVKLQ